MKPQLLFASLVLTTIGFVQGIQGQVIFSTFGPSDSFQSSLNQYGNTFFLANQFTPIGPAGTSYTLGSIDIAGALFSGDNVSSVSIWNDSSGAPGTLIETISLNGQLDSYSPNVDIAQGSSTLYPELEAGINYWISFDTSSSNTSIMWFKSTTAGTAGSSENGGSFSTFSTDMNAFRLNSQVIPEPSTYALMIGAACLVFVVWRRGGA